MKSRWIQYKIIVFFLLLISCGDGEDDVPDQLELPGGEFIDEFSYRVFPRPGDNFNIAEFRLWIPEKKNLKAIMVLLHSYNSNGLGMANSTFWQKFATDESLAILSVHFKESNTTNGYYAFASHGSGRALLEGLKVLSAKYADVGLEELPFVLRGYSAGGVFSHSFSAFQPERVIAFANIRGGSLDETSDINNAIPGLMLYGENDDEGRNKRIIDAVELNREKGGVWALIKEPGVDHFGRLEKADILIQKFFSKALRKRLLENTEALMSLNEEEGWLGNHSTFEVLPFETYPGSKKQASWLFDEEFALLWQNYQVK